MPDTKKRYNREYYYDKNHPVKTFSSLFTHERKNLLLATLFLIIKHSPVWVLPVTTANIVNLLASAEGDYVTQLVINIAVTAIFVLQNIGTHVLYTRYFALTSRETEARLRNALIQRLQQLSISFHDDYKSGAIQSKVLRDVDSILNMINQVFSNVVLAIITVIFAFTVTLLRKPAVSFFFLLLIPAAVVLMYLFRNKMQANNTLLRVSMERMTARISEMIEMIPVTRAHALEDEEIRKMGRNMEEVKTQGIKLDVINAFFGATSWVVFQVFQLISLGVSAYLAYRHLIPIGDVVLYQSFYAQITGAVNFILAIYPQITRGYDAFISLSDILMSPDVEQNEGKPQLQHVHGDFRFDHVSFKYPNTKSHAVNDFSLEVRAGESIAVVGQSGSGKSTLMQLLMGFRRPQTGKIFLDDRDMEEIDLRSYRRFLSVVPQNTILFSGTIRENVSYGLPHVSEARIREAVSIANAEEFIETLPDGLSTVLGEHGARLSGGQKQRIAIARAVIRDPRVIIFDEATSSLDVQSEKLVQDALLALVKGRTTFIVAHRLSTIRNANRIIVMGQGYIVEMGTYAELIAKNAAFAKLKSLQD